MRAIHGTVRRPQSHTLSAGALHQNYPVLARMKGCRFPGFQVTLHNILTRKTP